MNEFPHIPIMDDIELDDPTTDVLSPLHILFTKVKDNIITTDQEENPNDNTETDDDGDEDEDYEDVYDPIENLKSFDLLNNSIVDTSNLIRKTTTCFQLFRAFSHNIFEKNHSLETLLKTLKVSVIDYRKYKSTLQLLDKHIEELNELTTENELRLEEANLENDEVNEQLEKNETKTKESKDSNADTKERKELEKLQEQIFSLNKENKDLKTIQHENIEAIEELKKELEKFKCKNTIKTKDDEEEKLKETTIKEREKTLQNLKDFITNNNQELFNQLKLEIKETKISLFDLLAKNKEMNEIQEDIEKTIQIIKEHHKENLEELNKTLKTRKEIENEQTKHQQIIIKLLNQELTTTDIMFQLTEEAKKNNLNPKITNIQSNKNQIIVNFEDPQDLNIINTLCNNSETLKSKIRIINPEQGNKKCMLTNIPITIKDEEVIKAISTKLQIDEDQILKISISQN